MIEFKTKTQIYIFFTVIALLGIGLIMVASSSVYISEKHFGNSYYFLVRQAMMIIIGLAGMFWLMQRDYQELRKNSKLILFLSVILLICVFLPGIGISRHGAARWINLGFTQFQPSEFAKLAVIIYMADVLSRKPEKEITKFKTGFLPIVFVMGSISALVLEGPDMGTALQLAGLGWLLCLIAGVKKAHLFSLIPLTLPLLIYEIFTNRHQLNRILIFLNPDKNHLAESYQINQSLIAIGSGGLWGRGLGQGLQKHGFLPEPHTDFIFAIICEEAGFIGATLVLLLFGILIWQGLRVAWLSVDLFASLLTTGIITMISFQVIINTGMATGILPTKGMTLPFISYGGSSIVVTLLAIGILLNISKFIIEPINKK